MIGRWLIDKVSNFNNADSLSARFRRRRFDKFRSLFPIRKGDGILDLGGSEHFWTGSGMEDIVTILNIDIKPGSRFKWVKGDACDLSMFSPGHFSIVFSNSVIEHVGDIDRQERMAQEIQRVGKRYWIQTPYKHFPIEAHFLFPFFQYLPRRPRQGVAKHWPFSYAKLFSLDPAYEADHIWLLDKTQMRRMFPDGRIIEERFLGITKSLIALKT